MLLVFHKNIATQQSMEIPPKYSTYSIFTFNYRLLNLFIFVVLTAIPPEIK